MVYTLIFHELIEDDISEAYNWYEDELTGLGERFFMRLRYAIEKSRYPQAHTAKTVPDSENKYTPIPSYYGL